MYGEVFTEINPKTAVSNLVSKLKKTKEFGDEFLDFIKDLQTIEDQRSKLLLKLYKKSLSSNSNSNSSNSLLSSFDKVYTGLINLQSECAQMITVLNQKLDFTEIFKLQSNNTEDFFATLSKTELALNKLVKEYQEKEYKIHKLEKSSSNKNHQKKLADAKEQMELFMEQWKNDNSSLFNRFEAIDRSQMQLYKDSLIKLIDSCVDNLHLQQLKYEQLKKQVSDIDISKEIELFCSVYGKNDSEQPNHPAALTELKRSLTTLAPDLKRSFPSLHRMPFGNNSTRHSNVDLNASTNANQTTTNPENPTSPGVEVDAEGYRIPQMDVNKWKQVVPGIAFNQEDGDDDGNQNDSQPQQQQKIKFNIAQTASETKREDLEAAANALKGALISNTSGSFSTGSSNTSSRRARRIVSNPSDTIKTEEQKQQIFSTPTTNRSLLDASNPSLMGSVKSLNTPAVSSQNLPSPLRNSIAPEPVPLRPKADFNQSKNDIHGSGNSTNSADPNTAADDRSRIKNNTVLFKIQEIVHAVGDAEGKNTSVQATGQLQVNCSEKSPMLSLLYNVCPGDVSMNPSEGIKINPGELIFSCEKEKSLCKYSGSITSELPYKITGKLRYLNSQAQLVVIIEKVMEVSCSEIQLLVSANASSSLVSKPAGVWNNEKKKLLWKVFVEDGTMRLLAQWEQSEGEKESLQPVLVKYSAEQSLTLKLKGIKDDQGRQSMIRKSQLELMTSISAIVPIAKL